MNRHPLLALLSLASAGVAATLPLAASADPVSPVELGRSTNAQDGFHNNVHRVAVDSATGTVVFAHSQDVTVWGGGSAASGQIRVDVSTDGGATFANDTGIANPTYTRVSRAPNVVLLEAAAGRPVTAAWLSTTLDATPARNGVASGIAEVETWTLTAIAEGYFLDAALSDPGYVSSLCRGAGDAFWAVVAGTAAYDPRIYLLSGEYSADATSTTWSVARTFEYSSGLGESGEYPPVPSPVIAFSPDGSTAWLAWLGARYDGEFDETLKLMLSHSSDGGENWSEPRELDLGDIEYVGSAATWSAQLGSLGTDLSGVVTASGELDLAVDSDGNPHILLNAANRSTDPGESFVPDTTVGHMLVDVTSTNGGATLVAYEVAYLHAHTNEFGIDFGWPDDQYVQGNRPQIARNTDGTAIFYAWTDSTTEFTAVDGVNLAPNLQIAGMRLDTNAIVGPRGVTDGDIIWEGSVLLWSMAPTVLETADLFFLPVVAGQTSSGDLTGSVTWYFFGNDATLDRDAFGIVDEPGDDVGGGGDSDDLDAGTDVNSDVVDKPDTGTDTSDEIDSGSDTSVEVDASGEADTGAASDGDAGGSGSEPDGSDDSDAGDEGSGSSGGGGSAGCTSTKPASGGLLGFAGIAALLVRRRRSR